MRQRPIQLTGDPEADVEVLRERLEELDSDEAPELCRMLAGIASPSAGEALRRLAVNQNQPLRAAAVAAMSARHSDPETETALRHALGDPRPVVVHAALDVIAAHDPATFRNELRALANMPNEDASDAWLSVANRAMSVLATTCTIADLDLATRAAADAKLESGGSDLLAGLLLRLPIEALHPLLAGHHEQCAQIFPRLTQGEAAPRLEAIANSGVEPAASHAARSLQLARQRTDLRYIPPDARRAVRDIQPLTNDGYEEQSYEFCTDGDLNHRLSGLINAACHVFRAHPDGEWRSTYKDIHARRFADEIRANPWLIKRLFALRDRVVASVTYRAMELRDDQ